MSLSLRLLPQAVEDIRETSFWYDGRLLGLGDEFVAQLNRVLDLIEARPTSFPLVARSVRKALLSRFPYCVYFSVREDELVVLAVVHGKRKPGMWRQRIAR
jgi:hypothetical protein